jgi:hypothetical protein
MHKDGNGASGSYGDTESGPPLVRDREQEQGAKEPAADLFALRCLPLSPKP